MGVLGAHGGCWYYIYSLYINFYLYKTIKPYLFPELYDSERLPTYGFVHGFKGNPLLTS